MLRRANLCILLGQPALSNFSTVSTTFKSMPLCSISLPIPICWTDQMGTAKMVFFCASRRPFTRSFGYGISLCRSPMLRECFHQFDHMHRHVEEGTCKINALSACRQFTRNSDIGIEEASVDKINGYSSSGKGNFLKFPEHQITPKLVVAVDVDEVLCSFLSALNMFIADRYSLNHSVSEYHVYEFFRIWKCSRGEADVRVHEFFKTHYFKTGIQPIPGAHRALLRLSVFCNLLIVTSRQNVIKSHTVEWIEHHYSGLFKGIHFGNHFALDGQSIPKSDICRSLGVHVLVDDNPRYALECAEAGIRVLLFDYENSYPWCKVGNVDKHPLVTKVRNWLEVEERLLRWVAS